MRRRRLGLKAHQSVDLAAPTGRRNFGINPATRDPRAALRMRAPLRFAIAGFLGELASEFSGNRRAGRGRP